MKHDDGLDPVARLIDGAEAYSDPLDDLVERARKDPGAPFTPEMLERLDVLKREDRARFERIRAALKAEDCRVTALDNALRDLSPDGSERETQSDRILDLAARADLFRAEDETAFADVMLGSVRQTWPVRSPGFRAWLVRLYHEETGRVPNNEAVGAALNLIEAKARYDSPMMRVSVRTASHEGRIYIDLGDDGWRAIEIDTAGWRVVEMPPVRFRRARGTKALPVPVAGGTIDLLRPFLNVHDETDFILAVAWLIAALSPFGPYPVLSLFGEQGSAKSTFTRFMVALSDPRIPDTRSLPKEERDLFISARNAQVLAFDNVSSIPLWMSDAFCRLATGGGFSTRKLHTDDDEALFSALRPIVLNGIEEYLARPDLADRALALELQVLSPVRPEREVHAAFAEAQPEILGVLCDALSTGLRRIRDVHLADPPRMADFAEWVTACESALWREGAFMDAYTSGRERLIEAVLDGDPVAASIRTLIGMRGDWTGTATELLMALEGRVEAAARGRSWPASARALSNRVRRITSFLRRVSIEVSFSIATDRNRTRLICISRLGDMNGEPSSASSAHPDNGDNMDAADEADAKSSHD